MDITTIGTAYPLGATPTRHGVNFSIFSRNSQAVELLLFDSPDAPKPSSVISLTPDVNKTYHYWHVFVPHIGPGQTYAYRVRGEFAPEKGLRFDPEKTLLDPYGRAVWVPDNYDRGAACTPGDNSATAMRSVVADLSNYDWDNDMRPFTPWSKTVIYEMHVAGFTKHPNSGVDEARRGTYAGVIEKIPYLQDLGVTAVELLPVFHFDVFDAPIGRQNYWGYSPISFFAPHPFYASEWSQPLAVVDEFRDMVKAFHKAGIEVILDVVYNHTAEGNDQGPTLSFRGISNPEYYILEEDKRWCSNYSGCGNTLNGNNPVVRRMILDSLRYWANQMHVDGFRFDLASILTRDNKGRPLRNPPVLWDIETDPALAGVKLIAEAWDCGGLYQVGSFIGDSWKEWNGRFRDDVRSFIKGDAGSLQALPARLLGSPDIYEHEHREPEQSINFVTAHDGFTLNDVVTYNDKHNEANGEDNRDGHDDNRSWNCGAEGPTDDPEINALRERQIKNFFAITLMALGTPMIVMGDEVRRTQQGNNNAFAQDNEISWFDWSLVDKNQGLFRFVQQLIRRKLDRAESMKIEDRPLSEVLAQSQFIWHSTRLSDADWSANACCLGATIMSRSGKPLNHFMANTSHAPSEFELPGEVIWVRTIDTALPSTEDIELDKPIEVSGESYLVQPRSIVLLTARRRGKDRLL